MSADDAMDHPDVAAVGKLSAHEYVIYLIRSVPPAERNTIIALLAPGEADYTVRFTVTGRFRPARWGG